MLRAFYNRDAYFVHPYFRLRRKHAAGTEARCRRVFELLRKSGVSPAGGSFRLLDVGCDTGEFIEAAKRLYGVEASGIDISERAVAEARATGRDVRCCAVEDAPDDLRGYDLVTAIDVLEHTAHPVEVLRQCGERLNAGGYCYIETPNLDSIVYRGGLALCRMSGGRPASVFRRLFPPEHMVHFCPASLLRAAELGGLDVSMRMPRSIPGGELALPMWQAAALNVLQYLDRVSGRGLLLCALLRRQDTVAERREAGR